MTNEIWQTELSSLIQDNVDEILVKIIQFTHIRHTVISDNIRNCRCEDFVPRYIDAEDFAKVISAALGEHQRNQRLALCDSRTVSFLPDGDFRLEPQIDTKAAELLGSDFGAYIQLQQNRLKENSINNKAACALLEHKLCRQQEPVRSDSVKNKV
ncbi:MAG: hypothetical protein PHQ00_04210 [Phycisphaerae bacterium]|nr:hypothetical protein [Phycisphaerae bacterium]